VIIKILILLAVEAYNWTQQAPAVQTGAVELPGAV